MALVSISEASKLVNKSRQTLYKKINTGLLSVTLDDNGNKIIDTSELMRVFSGISKNKSNQSVTQVDTENGHELTTKNLLLKQENEHLKSLLKEKDEKVELLKHSIALLENKVVNQELSLLTPKKKWWQFFK